MADAENPALGKNLSKWKGVGAQVLKSYLNSENGGEKDDDNFSIDAFLNDFEDEFPNTVDEGATKPVYSEFAGRAFDQRPWGLKFGDRPKIHELNQPQRAQELGWRVIDFYPSREQKAEYYRLAGTPAELRQMTQILRATREITGKNINFEEWFKLWEDGFPEFKENRSPTNFPLDGENPWRGKTENKPRYREWTKPQQRLDFGYRVIEYWRDRSNEGKSVVLSGTDLDLIRHILQIEYEGGGSSVSKTPSFESSNKGLPVIRLYFEQDYDKIPKYPNGTLYMPLRGEITFRIPNKSEDPTSLLDRLTKADVKRYAEKIKTLFGDNGGYVWDKGKKVVAYNRPDQGFKRTWYSCQTHADGIALVTKLLAVTDQVIDMRRVTENKVSDEMGRFPENPTSIVILGEEVQQERERAIGSVRFKWAQLELSKKPRAIRLVEGKNIVYSG